MKALKRIMLVALAVMALTMTGATEAQAAKKPGEVTHLGETKVTSSSISFKFNKAKRAKEYEVQVYKTKYKKRLSLKELAALPADNEKPWSRHSIKATKNLVKKTKTKCTINGLAEDTTYAIKVRAVNGSKKGKWTTQFMRTTYGNEEQEGVQFAGMTSAEGKYLEKQYKRWKKYVAERDLFLASNMATAFCRGCVKEERVYRTTDPNNYTKADLLKAFKRGYWTDVEAYQVMKNIMDDYGIPCRIIRDITWTTTFGDASQYETRDCKGYLLVDLKNMEYINLHSNSNVCAEIESLDYFYDFNPSGVMPAEK